MNNNPRELAFLAINEILIDDAYSNITINKIFSKNKDLNHLDKKYITELVYGTVKNKIYLEYIVKQYVKSRIKPKIKNLLSMSLYQIINMDKTPNFATVNEAVNIAKKNGGPNAAKFVNAVLRNIIRTFYSSNLEYKNSIEKFCIENSCPIELFNILKKQYGEDKTKKIVSSFLNKSENSIRVNTLKNSKSDLVKKLKLTTSVKESNICEDCLLVDKIDFSSDLFLNGHFIVQDEASALVACSIDGSLDKHYNILDVCAAPGGKSLHIASKYFNSNVVSCDKYIHKLDLITKNAERLSINNIDIKNQDATIFNEKFENKFDIVVCDVPCSGLGVIKNKPEIKYKITNSQIEDLAKLQYKILTNSIRYLKKDGILIYSTCTIDKRENEENINKFLEEHKNFSLEKINTNTIVSQDRDGIFNIMPDEYNCDGFFIAKLIKKEN